MFQNSHQAFGITLGTISSYQWLMRAITLKTHWITLRLESHQDHSNLNNNTKINYRSNESTEQCASASLMSSTIQATSEKKYVSSKKVGKKIPRYVSEHFLCYFPIKYYKKYMNLKKMNKNSRTFYWKKTNINK